MTGANDRRLYARRRDDRKTPHALAQRGLWFDPLHAEALAIEAARYSPAREADIESSLARSVARITYTPKAPPKRPFKSLDRAAINAAFRGL